MGGGAIGPVHLSGGKGQQGEAGGLKAYVRGEGQPEKYGPLPTVTADQVSAFKETWNCEARDFNWPGSRLARPDSPNP